MFEGIREFYRQQEELYNSATLEDGTHISDQLSYKKAMAIGGFAAGFVVTGSFLVGRLLWKSGRG